MKQHKGVSDFAPLYRGYIEFDAAGEFVGLQASGKNALVIMPWTDSEGIVSMVWPAVTFLTQLAIRDTALRTVVLVAPEPPAHIARRLDPVTMSEQFALLAHSLPEPVLRYSVRDWWPKPQVSFQAEPALWPMLRELMEQHAWVQDVLGAGRCMELVLHAHRVVAL